MKITITEEIAVNLPLTAIANEIYAQGRYLKDNVSKQDLEELDSGFCGTDVRLQVNEDGGWALHHGSSDYDQDHRGFWSCSCISRGCSRADAKEIALELITGIE